MIGAFAVYFVGGADKKHIMATIGIGLVLITGVIVATPFGSTAYYHSITRKSFDKGIGVAFNNPTKPVNHLVLKEDSKVEIELVRGEASFATDNDSEILDLIEGQLIKIKKAKETAKIIEIKSH